MDVPSIARTVLAGIGRHRRWSTDVLPQDPWLKPEAAGEDTFRDLEKKPARSPPHPSPPRAARGWHRRRSTI
jgi:hypothetical protein